MNETSPEVAPNHARFVRPTTYPVLLPNLLRTADEPMTPRLRMLLLPTTLRSCLTLHFCLTEKILLSMTRLSRSKASYELMPTTLLQRRTRCSTCSIVLLETLKST